MFEALLLAIQSMAESLKSIATSLKDAAVRGVPSPAAAVNAAPAPAPAPVMPAPAPVAAPAAAVELPGASDASDDDIFGGGVPAAEPAKKLIRDEVLNAAKTASEKHGRPFVKEVLTKCGATNVKEMAEDKFAVFMTEIVKEPAKK